MSEPETFFEIELKCLLTAQKYRQLLGELPKKLELINEETVHTTRYRPGDVRLRYSHKTAEILCKEGDPTQISRRETRIPLPSKAYLEQFAGIFETLGAKPDPPWVKHKKEFGIVFSGFTYVICLQEIENFAHILEVEFLSEKNDAEVHEPNLKAIIRQLGCEPIEPEQFSKKIDEYIRENKFH